ncbi:MAG: hypothetical protein ACYCOU_12620, partial [Sulfobacillus sp.]
PAAVEGRRAAWAMRAARGRAGAWYPGFIIVRTPKTSGGTPLMTPIRPDIDPNEPFDFPTLEEIARVERAGILLGDDATADFQELKDLVDAA